MGVARGHTHMTSAKYLGFVEPTFFITVYTPDFGSMVFGYKVFGYMVFLALFRLYGQWSI